MTPVSLPSLFALLKPSMRRVLAARGHKQHHHHQQHRHVASWQPPSCDCYAILGVSRSASAADIKKAYLKKAMEKHPDTEGGGTDQMAQLNLCYEALTKKRSEYDAAKGVGGSGARASAYSSTSSYSYSYSSSSSRDPWWKAQNGRPEDFSDLGAEWEDLFYGRSSGRTSQRAQTSSRAGANSWQEWAHAWRQEHNANSEYRRQATSQRGRKTRQARVDTDSESDFDSDSDWEEEYFRSNRRRSNNRNNNNKPQTGRKSRAHNAGSDNEKWDDKFDSSNEKKARSRPWTETGNSKSPADIWISIPSPKNRGPQPENWSKLSGQFKMLEFPMNGKAAYQKAGNKGLYLFWSKEFGDWKLAERLEDDGSCLAYAEDHRGNKAPWKPFAPRWKLWEPNSRRFVLRKLNVVGCDPNDAEDDDGTEKASKKNTSSNSSSSSSSSTKDEEGSSSSNSSSSSSSSKGHIDDDDDQIPWSRPPWNQWSTSDLRRWCDRNDIDIKSCFDRESLLEKVISAANQTQAGKPSSSSRKKSKRKDFDEEDSDYSDDEDDDARHRKRRSSSRQDRRADRGGQQVRIASRVKTDGSYTKAPSLDKRVSLFGNRIERFRGRESDVLPWLYDYGDKSRLYGVFAGGNHHYSLVWKRGQYWGRPSMRDAPRHDRDYYW